MAKARIKVSSRPGKSGTKIAAGTIRIAKSKGRGEPIYRTKAQISVHPEKRNGEARE